DGIRDLTVTGVQTCALPISNGWHASHDTVPCDCSVKSPVLPFAAADEDSASSAPTDSLAFLRRMTSAKTRAFRRLHFSDVTTRDWNDWRWQSRHRIRTLAQLEKMLRLSDEEREALVQGGTMLPVGISPYYMSLLDAGDVLQPLRRTVVPTLNEFVRTEGEADDPLSEDSHSPVPGLVH